MTTLRENKILIAGVDEAGRGPLAGPVVAAAVVLPHDFNNEEIKDSKQLSPESREKLEILIKREALDWSVVAVGHRRIESLNILQASRLAMSLALSRIRADMALIDGIYTVNSPLPQKAVIKGDQKHQQISAASILAKVCRDRLMRILDRKYSGYGFSKHFGYGTPFHRKAIRELGPSKIHRRTFAGVKEHYASKAENNIIFSEASNSYSG